MWKNPRGFGVSGFRGFGDGVSGTRGFAGFRGVSAITGLAGAGILVLYGVIPTLQPAHFGRVYAAYGGIFIVVLSLLWGWRIDGVRPDRFDLFGGGVALAGVMIIMYWPRQP